MNKDKMDLIEMIKDKIRRDGIDQGIAAEGMSRYEPITRSTLNRFLNHEKIFNARHVIAMARWVGFHDQDTLIMFLQQFGFLPPELGEKEQQRLTLHYRLQAIDEELKALTMAVKSWR